MLPAGFRTATVDRAIGKRERVDGMPQDAFEIAGTVHQLALLDRCALIGKGQVVDAMCADCDAGNAGEPLQLVGDHRSALKVSCETDPGRDFRDQRSRASSVAWTR